MIIIFQNLVCPVVVSFNWNKVEMDKIYSMNFEKISEIVHDKRMEKIKQFEGIEHPHLRKIWRRLLKKPLIMGIDVNNKYPIKSNE